MAVLHRTVATLRSSGYANAVIDGPPEATAATRLALGLTLSGAQLGQGDERALVEAGAADVAGDDLVPRFAICRVDDVMVLVPRDGPDDPGRVYFGRDSLWLADLAARVGPGAGRAADLGTGAGTVAAFLGARYDLVVATDLVARTAACAAITLDLNRRPDGRPAGTSCVADVARCLCPGTFDLVTANPPWVPELGPRRDGPLVFADGGPTGFELPRRFAMEAASLLAPGGVAVVLALDIGWSDGSRPLTNLARGLRRLRYDVAVVPTEASAVWDDLETGLVARFPEMEGARHVALLIHRPPDAGQSPSPVPPSERRSRR
jgi:methylase of polypeptide subunit release factors